MEQQGPNVFTDNEKYLVQTLVGVSFLSLIGSLIIIFTYICFKKIRNFAYKLILNLSLADIILSIGNILSVATSKSKNQDSLCMAQAFLINYGGLASVLWTTIIAWSIFSATVLSAKNLRQKSTKFFFLGFGVPLIFSVIPFFTHQYGRAGLYCWIRTDIKLKDTIMRFAQFYVPLWIALAFNIYAYVKVVSFIKKYISTTLEIRFIHRLKAYPLVLVACWTFATINTIYNIFGKEIPALTFLHIFFGGLQGLLNAIVYGTNSQVKQVWKEKICCCFTSNFYSKYDDPSSLKKNEEMQQRHEQEYQQEDQAPSADGQNASVEMTNPRDTSENKKMGKNKNKLTIKV